MEASLDHIVAVAVRTSRLLERALHDSQARWEIGYGHAEWVFPARREVTSEGVTFSADFPSICWIGEPDRGAFLVCDGEMVAAKDLEHPGDGAFTIEWRLAVETTASVR